MQKAIESRAVVLVLDCGVNDTIGNGGSPVRAAGAFASCVGEVAPGDALADERRLIVGDRCEDDQGADAAEVSDY
jgi:hypothetical protein